MRWSNELRALTWRKPEDAAHYDEQQQVLSDLSKKLGTEAISITFTRDEMQMLRRLITYAFSHIENERVLY